MQAQEEGDDELPRTYDGEMETHIANEPLILPTTSALTLDLR